METLGFVIMVIGLYEFARRMFIVPVAIPAVKKWYKEIRDWVKRLY